MQVIEVKLVEASSRGCYEYRNAFKGIQTLTELDILIYKG